MDYAQNVSVDGDYWEKAIEERADQDAFTNDTIEEVEKIALLCKALLRSAGMPEEDIRQVLSLVDLAQDIRAGTVSAIVRGIRQGQVFDSACCQTPKMTPAAKAFLIQLEERSSG